MWAQGGVDPPVPGSGWDLTFMYCKVKHTVGSCFNVLQSTHTHIAKNTLLESEIHTGISL